ncbi:MAG: alpha/beta fold hydrolase [Candidatus Kariarchaeaceae archaeon]|jgi:pimeloyl-ACP methyl ester carboxylesterase
MGIPPEHPWFGLAENTQDYDQFVGRWLHDLNSQDLSKPALGIVNGWMAEHMQNLWYADAMRERMTTYAYDSRGQGSSPKTGDMHPTQMAIDANAMLTQAFGAFNVEAKKQGIHPGNKIVQGHCLGTMAIAAMFAAKLELSEQLDGAILISPVSYFSLPNLLKIGYFLPVWAVRFTTKYLAPTITRMLMPADDSELTRQNALERIKNLDPASAIKQVRQVFWKADVSDYWEKVTVPCLFLVSRHDPITRFEDSIDPFEKVPYPIWLELEAPDHMVLEFNIKKLQQLVPNFAKDPWEFYDNNKHLKPSH